MARVGTLLLVTAMAACQPGAPATPTPSGGTSLRGTVLVTGSEPATLLMLRRPDGSTIRLAGAAAQPLRALNRVDVQVIGRDSAGAYAVQRFQVVGVDGTPAVDGTLRAAGSDFVLELADGWRLPLQGVPDALKQHVDQRVWIAAPLAVASGAFGVVR